MRAAGPFTIRRRLLAICLAWTGTAVGLASGVSAVASGYGLSAPPVALACGLAGLAVGATLGVVTSRSLSTRAVRVLFPVAVVLALISAAALAVPIHRGRVARAARTTGDLSARVAPFHVSAVAHRPDDGSSFVEIEVDGAHDTFVMTVSGRPGQPRCHGEVTAARHAALLNAVRAAEARLAREPSACTPLVGEVIRTFRWRLPDRGGPPRGVAVTAACAAAYGEFEGLYAALDALGFAAASTAGALTCEPISTDAPD
jgi:hypothetical protein